VRPEGPLEVEGLIPIRDLLTQYKIELPDDLEVETLPGSCSIAWANPRGGRHGGGTTAASIR
jgi:hypothetical protein